MDFSTQIAEMKELVALPVMTTAQKFRVGSQLRDIKTRLVGEVSHRAAIKRMSLIYTQVGITKHQAGWLLLLANVATGQDGGFDENKYRIWITNRLPARHGKPTALYEVVAADAAPQRPQPAPCKNRYERHPLYDMLANLTDPSCRIVVRKNALKKHEVGSLLAYIRVKNPSMKELGYYVAEDGRFVIGLIGAPKIGRPRVRDRKANPAAA